MPINVLHRKFLKNYLQLPKRTPTKEIFTKSNILPLSDLFQLSVCKLIYTFLYSPLCLPPTISSLFHLTSQMHSHATRASTNLNLFTNSSNSTARANSISYISPAIWNYIPDDLKLATSPYLFQKNFKKYFLSKL